ncbi:hypothetical protein MTR67_040980 [Solanum verrucosum]|uniref:Complex III subunit VI n=1 Tax=Solanum verrucosum TaxID=315347 RepID=A0AAF0UKP5_SOLVR|nr:hypothetical protein MTR67_040980 [Solanum verrucosum]
MGVRLLFWSDEEVVDPKAILEVSCKPKCVRQLKDYQACTKRIEGDESGHKHCTGQYFDYWHCIDKCVSSLIHLFSISSLEVAVKLFNLLKQKCKCSQLLVLSTVFVGFCLHFTRTVCSFLFGRWRGEFVESKSSYPISRCHYVYSKHIDELIFPSRRIDYVSLREALTSFIEIPSWGLIGEWVSDEEVVDPKVTIEVSCKPKCVRQLKDYQACTRRIEGDESGSKHCTGQYFDYWQCIDKCVAPKLFEKLK